MKPVRRTALLLTNPASRRGADADLEEGLAVLSEAGIHVLQKEPRDAAHLCQLIRQYREHVDLYIIGGGDGTISQAAPALYECAKPFGILPLGTANDLARSIGLTGNAVEACRVIAANRKRRIDLGLVNDHYFFNVAHIGLGVHITHELTPEVKKKLGVFSYLRAFFRALSRRQVFRVAIHVEGTVYHQKTLHLAVGNGRFYGGGNVIDEHARIDSGELCLFSLKPQSVLALLTLAPLLRGGKQHLVKRTFTATGKHIDIVTTRPREIHADGEPAGFTPAAFKVLPSALEIFAVQPSPSLVSEEESVPP